ncbi:E3 ubiquitin-protein ligase RING1-like [Hibiscus syriacus]|uniref:E3 ubiquitin-protein ligase RING1-like n=1 Tax=Hibiscus syriacus TaxID=106335 RepID=UPI001921D2CF|nr:E3 ubiquitin-protein ligase RING1-like [Hibiscus syriacus]
MGFELRKTLSEDCDDLNCYQICTSSSSSTLKCFKLCSEHCDHEKDDLVFPPPPPPPSHHSKFPTKYLIATLTVLSFSFLIVCLYVYIIRRHRRRLGVTGRSDSRRETTETHDEFLDEDHGPVLDHHIWYINTVGLQPSIINSIKVFKYKKGDGVIEGTECSVCLTEFEEDETLRLLPKCSHAFHIPCIDTWLRSHTNCPMCRAPIVSANNGPSSSSIGPEVSEETRVPIIEDDGESEGGSGTSREDESAVENEVNSGVVQLQPVRRSVSLDSMAASRISQAIADGSNSDNEPAKSKESISRIVPRRVAGNHQSLLRLMSIGRSLQIRPIFMKRSFSCNGKFSLPISNKNRNRNPATRSF